LAVVHAVVKQSGGDIEVDSEEGKGTTFSIFLPLVEEAPAAVSLPASGPGARGTETILIVEDEDAIRHMLATGLSNYGFTVMTAGNGEEALGVASGRTARIDLLATDLVMPNMSGRDLADCLRKERPGLKVLFMSGYHDDGLLRDGAKDEERVSFLQKPFSIQTFAAKVREVLDQK
jgi:DNA-binding NtrC family response regulator